MNELEVQLRDIFDNLKDAEIFMKEINFLKYSDTDKDACFGLTIQIMELADSMSCYIN